MLVTILPFFLAAQVTVDPSRQSEWNMYGGECTYDVFVIMSLSNIAPADKSFCSEIKSDLKCRPKGQDSLSCHFQNSWIRHPGLKENNCTSAMDLVPTGTRFVGEEPFEIRFNPRGIQNLVVSKNTPRWQLDMIRAIVSQLNIGFEALERRDRFTIVENSTMNSCEVDVRFIHDSSEEEDDDDDDDEKDDSVEKNGATKQGEMEGQDFEIQFVSTNDKPARTLDEKFHVQKLRQPKSCPQRTIYFFRNEGDYDRGDEEIYMDMTDSVSHIMIEKNKFLSFTIAAGLITNRSQVVIRPQQHIRMKLKQIDLARHSLSEIQNPVSMSL
ncbi:PREDICTED: uncharacterized protein LOC106742792 [Dinoponera quadriceps]|uniref:Uncharacterized protein LOC106742792 n=1 Tax=Dinoponera quadriceps TaxID=609295 RepID=A0A6P3WZM4_DINQU|nr:PREDICTED: uncharacterized protein LOC106742792 [Dinoponera quadriceps]